MIPWRGDSLFDPSLVCVKWQEKTTPMILQKLVILVQCIFIDEKAMGA
jgi:hypothetical protein